MRMDNPAAPSPRVLQSQKCSASVTSYNFSLILEELITFSSCALNREEFEAPKILDHLIIIIIIMNSGISLKKYLDDTNMLGI